MIGALFFCATKGVKSALEMIVCDHVDVPELRLHGISDVHLGSSDCDEERFLALLQHINDDPAARIILNGDLLQYDTKGSVGDVYRQRYPPSQQKRLMREYLTPVKDKILGILGGNHDELRTQEDASPIQDIAEWLGVPYCAGEGLFKIPVGKGKNGKPLVYTVYCTHGWSNARLVGGKANNLHRLSDIVLADIYMISHTHTPMAFPDTFYVPDLRNNKVDKRVRYYVNTGSFQKRGQYPKRKGMRPVALLNPIVLLNGRERHIEVRL